jgi:hypothetical protein
MPIGADHCDTRQQHLAPKVDRPIRGDTLAAYGEQGWAIAAGRLYVVDRVNSQAQPIDSEIQVSQVAAGDGGAWVIRKSPDGAVLDFVNNFGKRVWSMPVSPDAQLSSADGASVWVSADASGHLAQVFTNGSSKVSKLQLTSDDEIAAAGLDHVWVAAAGKLELLAWSNCPADQAIVTSSGC